MNDTPDQIYASAIKSLDDQGCIVGFGPGEFLATARANQLKAQKPSREPVKLLRQLLSFLKAMEAGRCPDPKWDVIIKDVEACIAENEKT